MTDHGLGDAAEQEAFDACPAVTADHDEISGPALGRIDDLSSWRADFKEFKRRRAGRCADPECRQKILGFPLLHSDQFGGRDAYFRGSASNGCVYHANERDLGLE